MSALATWILQQRARASGYEPDVEPVAEDPTTASPRLPSTMPIAPVIPSIGRGLSAFASGALSGPVARPAPVPAPAAPPAAAASASSPGLGRSYELEPPVMAPPTPLFSPAEESEMSAQNAATTYKAPMRAIRMPNGTMLFTNREEYGGEEFSPEEGGRIVREQDRAAAASRPSPTSATMSALVRASARASAGESGMSMPAGKIVPGTTPKTTGGAASFLQGSDQQQVELKLEDAINALALAQTGQQKELAEMSPAESAILGNKDIQTGSWLLNKFLPQIQQVQSRAQEMSRLAAAIPDPKMRAAELARINDEASREVQALQAVMSVIMGVRPAAGPLS